MDTTKGLLRENDVQVDLHLADEPAVQLAIVRGVHCAALQGAVLAWQLCSEPRLPRRLYGKAQWGEGQQDGHPPRTTRRVFGVPVQLWASLYHLLKKFNDPERTTGMDGFPDPVLIFWGAVGG